MTTSAAVVAYVLCLPGAVEIGGALGYSRVEWPTTVSIGNPSGLAGSLRAGVYAPLPEEHRIGLIAEVGAIRFPGAQLAVSAALLFGDDTPPLRWSVGPLVTFFWLDRHIENTALRGFGGEPMREMGEGIRLEVALYPGEAQAFVGPRVDFTFLGDVRQFNASLFGGYQF